MNSLLKPGYSIKQTQLILQESPLFRQNLLRMDKPSQALLVPVSEFVT